MKMKTQQMGPQTFPAGTRVSVALPGGGFLEGVTTRQRYSGGYIDVVIDGACRAYLESALSRVDPVDPHVWPFE